MALAWGAAVALMNQPLHEWLLSDVGIELRTLTRYAAPVAEEILKAALIVVLLARRRIGFLIDAAVLGFAVGTGFAVVENFVFLQAMPDSPTMLWLVRGLGTATLHGATTAIAAVVAKSFQEQRKLALPVAVAAGVATAIVIHSAYNHLLLPPLAATIVLAHRAAADVTGGVRPRREGGRRLGGRRARPGPRAPGIADLAAVSDAPTSASTCRS